MDAYNNMGQKKKLLMVVNADGFFLSHRLPIALEAKKQGYDVVIAATDTGKGQEIENHGLKFVNVIFDRAGKNPFKELGTVRALYKIFKEEKPDVVHNVAIKPCIYGSLAARFAKVKGVVNAVTGLGYSFIDERGGFFQSFLKKIFKFSVKGNNKHFIFQNADDASFMASLCKLDSSKYTMIKGSGVNLNKFTYEEEPQNSKIRFILSARLLYDKGIVEFAKAAQFIKDEVKDRAQFIFVGSIDAGNLAGITEADLNKLLDGDYISWAGYSKDIFTSLKNSHVVVLPSYREGLPKSLIEAAAVGRPIITTDAPGCRECVVDGENGFLVPVKNSEELAKKMLLLIEDSTLRQEMGKKSRAFAEKKFSIENVVGIHLQVYSHSLI